MRGTISGGDARTLPRLAPDFREKLGLGQHRHLQLARLVELTSRRLTGDEKARLFADASRRFSAQLENEILDLLAVEFFEAAGNDDGLPGQQLFARGALLHDWVHP